MSFITYTRKLDFHSSALLLPNFSLCDCISTSNYGMVIRDEQNGNILFPNVSRVEMRFLKMKFPS